jgi:hypothetical protein
MFHCQTHSFKPGRVSAMQSNNNPVWLGLTTMLQKFRRSSIKDAAILSIGESIVHFGSIQPGIQQPGSGDMLTWPVQQADMLLALLLLLLLPGTGKDVSSTLYNSWTGKHDSIPSIGGLLATGNIMQGLIGMTMDLNGEDKESILDMLYSECLVVPVVVRASSHAKHLDCGGTQVHLAA